MTKLRRLAGLIVCGCLIWAGPVRADAVVDWNEIALQAITTAIAAGRPGVTTGLDLAMVHAAVYDAVQAIDRRFEPYHVEIPGASGSPAAAAAKAAHDVLVSRFPAQAASLDTTYHNYLANNGLAENDPGVAVGQQAAAGIIALRANDGTLPAQPDAFHRRHWSRRLAPDAILYCRAAPQLRADGRSVAGRPSVPSPSPSPTQFRAEPPPALTSARYTRDYNEVKALGGLVNSARTPEQTDLAYFWADNSLLSGTELFGPSPMRISTTLAIVPGSSPWPTWRYADAAITAWDSKRHLRVLAAGDRHSGRRQRRQPARRLATHLAATDQHARLS